MSGVNERSDYTTQFHTARHVWHSLDYIASKKFVTTYAEKTKAHAECESKNYCVPTEDVKLLRRNLRACLQEVTSSFRLFKLARSALQMMKYFSHRHKLQRFEAGLNGAACFKIFQVKLNPILASFKGQMCLLSSVLSLLFGSLKEDLWFEYLVSKEFSVSPT